MAALSLGIAYMETNNEKVLDILVTRLRLGADVKLNDIQMLEKYPRGITALAIGLVAMGSGNQKIADVLVRVMAGNSQNQRMLRFFPLLCIGLALIFL